MKTLNLTAFSFALLMALSACNSGIADEQLDNSNVRPQDMRAKEKNSTLETNNAAAFINLQQYEAITNYAEMVKGQLNTVVSVDKPAEVRFCILNSNGVLMQSFTEQSQAGENTFKLDFSSMELGEYFVVMVYNDVYRRFCVAKTN